MATSGVYSVNGYDSDHVDGVEGDDDGGDDDDDDDDGGSGGGGCSGGEGDSNSEGSNSGCRTLVSVDDWPDGMDSGESQSDLIIFGLASLIHGRRITSDYNFPISNIYSGMFGNWLLERRTMLARHYQNSIVLSVVCSTLYFIRFSKQVCVGTMRVSHGEFVSVSSHQCCHMCLFEGGLGSNFDL